MKAHSHERIIQTSQTGSLLLVLLLSRARADVKFFFKSMMDTVFVKLCKNHINFS